MINRTYEIDTFDWDRIIFFKIINKIDFLASNLL